MKAFSANCYAVCCLPHALLVQILIPYIIPNLQWGAGDLGLGDWRDIRLAVEACQEVGMFAKPGGMEFEVQMLISSRHFKHACLLLDVPPT